MRVYRGEMVGKEDVFGEEKVMDFSPPKRTSLKMWGKCGGNSHKKGLSVI